MQSVVVSTHFSGARRFFGCVAGAERNKGRPSSQALIRTNAVMALDNSMIHQMRPDSVLGSARLLANRFGQSLGATCVVSQRKSHPSLRCWDQRHRTPCESQRFQLILSDVDAKARATAHWWTWAARPVIDYWKDYAGHYPSGTCPPRWTHAGQFGHVSDGTCCRRHHRRQPHSRLGVVSAQLSTARPDVGRIRPSHCEHTRARQLRPAVHPRWWRHRRDAKQIVHAARQPTRLGSAVKSAIWPDGRKRSAQLVRCRPPDCQGRIVRNRLWMVTTELLRYIGWVKSTAASGRRSIVAGRS